MKKTRTKKNWIKEHLSDEFVKRAQKDGFRSRAAYKFIEMNDKYHLIRPNDRIVDLGSAPGSWSQAASSLISNNGKIFAIDLLPMDDVKNTTFIQGDFRELSILHKLEELLENVRHEIPETSFSQLDVIAKSLAKSLAIKNGKKLETTEQEELLERLFSCKEPNHSPYGKNTFITLPLEEIQLKFDN